MNAARRHSILIVDDQDSIRDSLTSWLEDYYEVASAADGQECLEVLGRRSFDMLLLDQRMPRMTGIEVLRVVAERYPEIPVIMMTAFGSVDSAVEAIKLGATDYLLKPVEPEALKLRVEKILAFREMAEENRQLRKQVEEKFSFHNIISVDATMRRICDRIETVAKSTAPILITGESGTGKELVARAVHLASDRASRPFVSVACGATPDTLIEAELFGHEKGAFTGALRDHRGKFEEAADGTIFLDEIGELSPSAQVKFLRVLQERTFRRVGGEENLSMDARIVSATNRDLSEAIAAGEFRQDLYYRIQTVLIDLPPLRHRRGDVALLAAHFLEQFARQYEKTRVKSIGAPALAALQAHSWPGNVRELKGAIEQAVILCQGDAIGAEDLPAYLTREHVETSEGHSFHELVDDFGRSIILDALSKSDGVKKDAAELLGISPRALSHYLKKFGITS